MNEKFVYTVRESTRFSEMLLYGNRFAIDTVEKVAKNSYIWIWYGLTRKILLYRK